MSESKPRGGAYIAARAMLLIAGLCVGFITAEILVRVLGLEPGIHVIYRENFRLSDNPLLKYELQPHSRDGRSRINSSGMRDDEYLLDKPRDVYRILVAGDSVAYGLTVKQEQAFPQQLETLLNSRPDAPRRFEVLNLGVSGYNIDQIIERLRVLGVPHAPDLIIYAYSLNDPQNFSLELQGLSAMHEEARVALKPGQTFMRWLTNSRVFLLAWRAFQEPWTRPVRPARQSPDYLAVVSGRQSEYFGELHSGDSWRRVEEGFSELAALAREMEKRPRVLVAVLPIHLGPGSSYSLEELHLKIIAEVRHHGLEALDLAPALTAATGSTEHAHFNDPFHPTALGHRLTALALQRWLDSPVASAEEKRPEER